MKNKGARKELIDYVVSLPISPSVDSRLSNGTIKAVNLGLFQGEETVVE